MVKRRNSGELAAGRGRLWLVAAGVALAVGTGMSFAAQNSGAPGDRSAPGQDSTRAFIVDQDPADNGPG